MELNTESLSYDTFVLPTKATFSLENVKSTSLGLLSSNADTHYSLGMSYMLLLSDMEGDDDNDSMQKEWMKKSQLHFMACASVYCCMIGRICDCDGYDNPDDIGHVEFDGEVIGWKNFQEDGYLKLAFGSQITNDNRNRMTSSKVIRILRERISHVKPNDINDIQIINDMKEMLNEIQETVDSPRDSMMVLLGLSKVKAKVAVEAEQRIKNEAMEEGKRNRRRHREKPVALITPKAPKTGHFKSPKTPLLPSMNGLSKKQTLSSEKRKRLATISPASTPDSMRPIKNPNSVPTHFKLSPHNVQKENDMVISNETTNDASVKAYIKAKKNLNLWDIGSPIFRDTTEDEKKTSKEEDKKDEWAPLPSQNLQSDFKIDSSQKQWKDAPASTRVAPMKEKKKALSKIRKINATSNVHANYDSKRHNRYRPMMKKKPIKKEDATKKEEEVVVKLDLKPKVVEEEKPSIWKVAATATPAQSTQNFPKKSMNKVIKKTTTDDVLANYDSKRHNRYRPMMKKKSRAQRVLDERRRKLASSAKEAPTTAVKHAPKGNFGLTFL